MYAKLVIKVIYWLKPSAILNSSPEVLMSIIDRQHPERCQFDSTKFQKGLKVVRCGNRNVLEYVTNYVCNQEKL